MCGCLLRVMTLIFAFRSSTSSQYPCIVLHVRGKTFQLNKVIPSFSVVPIKCCKKINLSKPNSPELGFMTI